MAKVSKKPKKKKSGLLITLIIISIPAVRSGLAQVKKYALS